jgi:tRNA-specific 2-thiouridylase
MFFCYHKKMKVIVGMSGGVDSSVTAYLLKEQGYEVEGVSFILFEARLKNTFTGCCSIESVDDAGRTAERIGIKHAAIDLRDEFMSRVIEPFIDAYSRGMTPNPCILCNKHIKFPYLLRMADERKAEFIATGHYARTFNSGQPATGGQPMACLRKGIDSRKDQSYVLYVLRQEELKRLVLPLGDKKKDEVRRIARELGLPAAERPESQEICFVEDKKYFKLLDDVTGPKQGPIIDVQTGETLGTHNGVYHYTVGQRKRLSIATGKPLYVAKIDPSQNAVYVGPRESAEIKEFMVEEVNWIEGLNRSSAAPNELEKDTDHSSNIEPRALRTSVKVRSTMKDEPATINILNGDAVKVVYDEPQWAPSPGQSAVFYDKDVVMGGGVISR